MARARFCGVVFDGLTLATPQETRGRQPADNCGLDDNYRRGRRRSRNEAPGI
jgi:hypothetical protein